MLGHILESRLYRQFWERPFVRLPPLYSVRRRSMYFTELQISMVLSPPWCAWMYGGPVHQTISSYHFEGLPHREKEGHVTSSCHNGTTESGTGHLPGWINGLFQKRLDFSAMKLTLVCTNRRKSSYMRAVWCSKMVDIVYTKFWSAFPEWNKNYFDSDYIEILFPTDNGSTMVQVIIIPPNRRESNTWTNVDRVPWRHMTPRVMSDV